MIKYLLDDPATGSHKWEDAAQFPRIASRIGIDQSAIFHHFSYSCPDQPPVLSVHCRNTQIAARRIPPAIDPLYQIFLGMKKECRKISARPF
jgi:hypothetical protein